MTIREFLSELSEEDQGREVRGLCLVFVEQDQNIAHWLTTNGPVGKTLGHIFDYGYERIPGIEVEMIAKSFDKPF